jgi:hypothetical protein
MLELTSPVGDSSDDDDVLHGSISYHQTVSSKASAANSAGKIKAKTKAKPKTSTAGTTDDPGSDAILMNMIAQLESKAGAGIGDTTGRDRVEEMLAQMKLHEPAGGFHLDETSVGMATGLGVPLEAGAHKSKAKGGQKQVGVPVHMDTRSTKVVIPPRSASGSGSNTAGSASGQHLYSGMSTARAKTAEKQQNEALELELERQNLGEIDDLTEMESALDRECMELQRKLAGMMLAPPPAAVTTSNDGNVDGHEAVNGNDEDDTAAVHYAGDEFDQ